MPEIKRLSEKRLNRVNLSLTDAYKKKLDMLAVSCNMHPTTMAEVMVRLCLDNANTINYLQEKYNVNPEYKILPIREDGELRFTLK